MASTPSFSPRSYQLRLLMAMADPAVGGLGKKRAVAVWHRRAGKDRTALNWTVTQATTIPGVYYFFYPTYAQGKKILWDGKDKQGRSFLDDIPEHLITGKNETEMQLKLRVLDGKGVDTGMESVFQIIGTDNMNSIVGTNPRGCVFSEFAIQDPAGWDLVRPILRENGGWALFLYTPRGRNHGWRLYEMARKIDNRANWFCDLLTVNDTRRDADGEDGSPVITAKDIEDEIREGMDPDLVQQEFFCSFTGLLQGSYYGKQIELARSEERIAVIPWDPARYVSTAWDIGIGDQNAIWFYQTNGFAVNLIEYHEATGWGVPEYAKFLKERPYAYHQHFGPHDIKQREWGSGKKRIQTAQELGITFQVAPKLKVEEGIAAVRRLFPRLRFDAMKCERGVDCLASYHKEWDGPNQCFKNQPDHDWSSHGADAMRTLALTLLDPVETQPARTISQFDPMNYENEFDPMEDRHAAHEGR